MEDFRVSTDWVAKNLTPNQWWQSKYGEYPEGYVYVLWVKSSAFYKIGYTQGSECYVHERARHFDARLTGGVESELLLFRPCMFPRLMEKWLHTKFAQSRIRVYFSSSLEIFYLEPMEFIELNADFKAEAWLMRQLSIRKEVEKLMALSTKAAA